MIHLVVALPCEARPLLRRFELRAVPDKGPFRVYENEQFRLIVSGVGKLAAAAATAYLQGRNCSQGDCGWLNIGTAGHAERPVGSGLLAHCIRDAGSGLNWFPPLLLETTTPTATVVTVEQPETGYPGTAAYDMEAAGFAAAASRCATSELVHSYKVISDNHREPIIQVNKGLVEELIKAQLNRIEQLLQQLAQLTAQMNALQAPPPALATLLDHRHFTTTEGHRLERLLRRWQLLSGDNGPYPELERLTSGRAVLAWLQTQIDHRLSTHTP